MKGTPTHFPKALVLQYKVLCIAQGKNAAGPLFGALWHINHINQLFKLMDCINTMVNGPTWCEWVLNHFHTGHLYTFPPRPIFSFQRCCTLNDNCAVMLHCTQTNFVPTNRAFFWWYLITSGIFIFCKKYKKITENLGKKRFFCFCYKTL